MSRSDRVGRLGGSPLGGPPSAFSGRGVCSSCRDLAACRSANGSDDRTSIAGLDGDPGQRGRCAQIAADERSDAGGAERGGVRPDARRRAIGRRRTPARGAAAPQWPVDRGHAGRLAGGRGWCRCGHRKPSGRLGALSRTRGGGRGRRARRGAAGGGLADLACARRADRAMQSGRGVVVARVACSDAHCTGVGTPDEATTRSRAAPVGRSST